MLGFCKGQTIYDHVINNSKKYPCIRGHPQNKRGSWEKSKHSD